MVASLAQKLTSHFELVQGLHPVLYAQNDDFERIRNNIAADAEFRRWYMPYKLNADYSLTLPPFEREIRDGLRLLHVSQDMTSRLNSLSLAYRVEKDPAYARRAYAELEHLATFEDWNPSHFLDLAQMTYAAALCYDWIYDSLSESERTLVRNMLCDKSLRVYEECYRNFASGRKLEGGKDLGTWTHNAGNWNFWCNGAAIALAIVLGEHYPDTCSFVIQNAIASLGEAMECYAPDGGFAEGVSYGMAANSFWAQLTWALMRAFGDDFGMLSVSGMADFAYFVLYMTGPVTGFNFHDSGGNGKHCYSSGFFVANELGSPLLGAERAKALTEGREKASIFDLIWYTGGYESDNMPLAPDRYFRKVETGSMRSSFTDPDAIWLGFHGGSDDVAHMHLDSGSFVIDALGENWALDLGTEPLSYFGTREQIGNPFLLYRLSSEGHNTVVINPSETAETQAIPSFSPIERFDTCADGAFAVMNLTSAYTRQTDFDGWDLHARIDKTPRERYDTKVTSAKRGFALSRKRRSVVIQDEWDLIKASDFWWSMHTDADVSIADDGMSATLSKHGKCVRVSLDERCNAHVRFELLSASPLPGGAQNKYQTQNTGINKLAIHISHAECVRLRVRFDFSDASESINSFVPLDRWETKFISGGTI